MCGYFMKKSFALCVLIPVLFVLGCKKEKVAPPTTETVPPTETTPLGLRKLDSETQEYIEDKTIVVLLGYGYNDEMTVSTITQCLDEQFGVQTDEKDGLVSILVYPSDFIVAGKIRISSLLDLIEEQNLCGMIILGAPEGTHIALAKLQDKEENGRIPYPVFTFLSQDDILGAEATSDFVLDYAHKTGALDDEATTFIPDFDCTEILCNSIQQMITLREPLKSDSNLMPFVQKLLSEKRTVSHYIDSETAIPSINHFVFE